MPMNFPKFGAPCTFAALQTGSVKVLIETEDISGTFNLSQCA